MFFRLVVRTFELMPACAYLKDCAIENICGDLFNFVLCIITINILDILFYIYIMPIHILDILNDLSISDNKFVISCDVIRCVVNYTENLFHISCTFRF